MKRRILTIMLFLLLGAIVNVAVAWGCAITHQRELSTEAMSQAESDRLWERYAPADFPSNGDIRSCDRTVRLGWTSQEVELVVWSNQTPSGSVFVVIKSEFGVPFRSLHGVDDIQGPLRIRKVGQLGRGAIRSRWYIDCPVDFSNAWIHSAKLPIGIEPLGITLDTLTYATMSWLVFVGHFALRRRRRKKRGLCPACAYPVGTSEVCTECGKPVRPRRVAA